MRRQPGSRKSSGRHRGSKMLFEIPTPMQRRMRYLEEIDLRDRTDGTLRQLRLRQIPPETGRFIAWLAAGAPPGLMIEIGTSAGYSTLWLALACRLLGCRITTFEILPEKAALARETFRLAEVEEVVELVEGNARDHLAGFNQVAFCFLDTEKEIYLDCYEAVVPGLVPGGLLVADNAITHAQALQPMLDRATSDPRVEAVIAAVGKGLLLCRKR